MKFDPSIYAQYLWAYSVVRSGGQLTPSSISNQPDTPGEAEAIALGVAHGRQHDLPWPRHGVIEQISSLLATD